VVTWKGGRKKKLCIERRYGQLASDGSSSKIFLKGGSRRAQTRLLKNSWGGRSPQRWDQEGGRKNKERRWINSKGLSLGRNERRGELGSRRTLGENEAFCLGSNKLGIRYGSREANGELKKKKKLRRSSISSIFSWRRNASDILHSWTSGGFSF